jgi:hypothetical protein
MTGFLIAAILRRVEKNARNIAPERCYAPTAGRFAEKATTHYLDTIFYCRAGRAPLRVEAP